MVNNNNTLTTPLTQSLPEINSTSQLTVESYSGRSAAAPPVPNANTVLAAVGQFVGGGSADLVYRNTSTGATEIWEMDGQYRVSTTVLSGTPSTAWSLEFAGDLNNDGKDDLFWRNYTTGDNQVWYMNGTSLISAATINNLGTNWKAIGLGDFNSDGKNDIVWDDTVGSGVAYWAMNGATFLSANSLQSNADNNWRATNTGDVNGDGKTDIYFVNIANSTNNNAVWVMNGATYVTSTLLPNNPSGWGSWQVYGDDIYFRNNTTLDTAIWNMSGSTLTSAQYILGAKPNTLGDIDNNGSVDFVVRNYSNGNNGFYSTSGVYTSLTASTDLNWRLENATGDFDNNGSEDIVWRNYSNGQVAIWLMNGTSILSPTIVTTVSDLNWQIEGVYDMNKDGIDDIIIRNFSTGENGIWFMGGTNGTTLVSSTIAGTSGAGSDIMGVGDLNKDGVGDIVFHNTVNGNVAIWYMNSGGTIQSTLVFNQKQSGVFRGSIADVNNDNHYDFVWTNLQTGAVSYWSGVSNPTASTSFTNNSLFTLPNLNTKIEYNGAFDYGIQIGTISTPQEAGYGTIQIRLTSAPTSNVTVTVNGDALTSIDNDTVGTNGMSNTFVFTPSNWNVYQTVQLISERDGVSSNRNDSFITLSRSDIGGGVQIANYGNVTNTYSPDTTNFNMVVDYRNASGAWTTQRQGWLNDVIAEYQAIIKNELTALNYTSAANENIIANSGGVSGQTFSFKGYIDDVMLFVTDYYDAGSGIAGAAGITSYNYGGLNNTYMQVVQLTLNSYYLDTYTETQFKQLVRHELMHTFGGINIGSLAANDISYYTDNRYRYTGYYGTLAAGSNFLLENTASPGHPESGSSVSSVLDYQDLYTLTALTNVDKGILADAGWSVVGVNA